MSFGMNQLSTIDLLQKYDVAGPRYTSYPTVPAWTESVGTSEYEAALASVKSGENLSLYFHLPFCEQLCHFCGCFKVITKDHSRSAPYMKALLSEVKAVSAKLKNSDKKVSQIHLGGGTPNFISPEELAELMTCVRSEFSVMPDAEVAIEMHPRTSTKEFCEELARQGFNRISLGVQSFDEHVQTLINRHQTYEQTSEMLATLRELGFKNFNFDLIYGLPGQSVESFSDTLEKTLNLSPDRLAVYSYAHVPWKSKVQRSFQDSDLPGPETKLKLFEMAFHKFAENGYHLIGMDHFAKESDELFTAQKQGSIHRNFMGYSTKADAHQIGFGVSSISYVNGSYFQNGKSVEEYQEHSFESELYTYRGYLLNQDDHIRRAFITELMCHLKVDLDGFGQKYGIDTKDYFSAEWPLLGSFEEDGLLRVSENTLQVLDQGKLVIRNIAMCFDAYLDEIRKTAKNPVFSRTV
jgi:oxygen-independent coproporphyrinogen-3 oxidase